LAKTLPAVTIVGGETLLGRELRELLDHSGLAARIQLAASIETQSAIIIEQEGEPAIIPSVGTAEVAAARLILLAGAAEAGVRAIEALLDHDSHPAVIDLTGALEDRPEARLRAPLAETDERAPEPLQIIAHPAAIALAMFFRRLQRRVAIRQAVVQIFEPASEQGQRGIDELQKQTVSLLSLKNLPKDIYDAQVSFNLLPRYGSEAPKSLDDIEQRIERHLASLLAADGGAPMPSLRLVQAPVFHGYSFSIWVEFAENPGARELASALATAQIDVRSGDEEAPSNVGAAGQSGVTVGAIEVDRGNPRACWFWMVADNLRLISENAVEVARATL
jgi:aspartate-semialdehyde dehydrogenase